jgi:hypothetical protein
MRLRIQWKAHLDERFSSEVRADHRQSRRPVSGGIENAKEA